MGWGGAGRRVEQDRAKAAERKGGSEWGEWGAAGQPAGIPSKLN